MENIWNIIKQFNNNFKEPIPDDLICVICRSILTNAHQGVCGCKYCYECIHDYFSNDKKCPGKKPECQINNDYVIDYSTNHKLSHLKVKCLKENCEFEDELCKIEKHMIECKKSYEDCPFSVVGCRQNNINMEIMPKHLENNTMNHFKFLMNFLKRIEFKSQRRNDEIMKYMNEIKSEFDRELTSLKAESNKNEIIISELRQYLNECAKREQIKDERIKKLELRLENTRNEFQQFINEQRDLNRIEESRLIIEYLKNQKMLKTFNKMREMEQLTGRICILETIFKKENTFIWKIDKITERLQLAELERNTDLFSEKFAAYKNGYLLKLRLTPNGYKAAKGNFMSVFFCLEKGKFDELISWPIKDDIIIDLIDQNNRNGLSQSFNYEKAQTDDKSAFDRPSFTPQYYGNYRFINISELFKSFVKDDTIILTCYVRR